MSVSRFTKWVSFCTAQQNKDCTKTRQIHDRLIWLACSSFAVFFPWTKSFVNLISSQLSQVCSHFTYLQTKDTFSLIYISHIYQYSSFSRLLQYVSYHIHTTAEYHVGRWRAWWWNYTAAKWKTAIPDCVSTFVSAKPKETCSFKGLHIHGWQKCTSLTFILATELIQSNCSQCIREI